MASYPALRFSRGGSNTSIFPPFRIKGKDLASPFNVQCAIIRCRAIRGPPAGDLELP